MIKPEQVPYGAARAAYSAWARDGGNSIISAMEHAIAAAINAWPGMQPQEWHGAGPRIILPLTEASDE